MADYRGTLQSRSRTAARCGDKSTGMCSTLSTWSGRIETRLQWDEKARTNIVSVTVSGARGEDPKVVWQGALAP